MPGPIEEQISSRVTQQFAPTHLVVTNESSMHNVPPGSESHFKLTIISEQFAGLARVRRQQLVYKALSDLLAGPVHALSLLTLTPQEWSDRSQKEIQSPDCRGGGASD